MAGRVFRQILTTFSKPNLVPTAFDLTLFQPSSSWGNSFGRVGIFRGGASFDLNQNAGIIYPPCL